MAHRQVMSVFHDIENESKLKTKYFQTLHKNGDHGLDNCWKGMSDLFYVPAHVKEGVTHLLNIHLSRKVVSEIAVPMTLFGVTDKNDMIWLNSTNLWGKKRKDPWKYLSRSLFVHPAKFSNPANREPFCQQYLTRT